MAVKTERESCVVLLLSIPLESSMNIVLVDIYLYVTNYVTVYVFPYHH